MEQIETEPPETDEAEIEESVADSDERLGSRLYRLRRERGLTQKDIAGERYSAAFVSTVESGRRRPSPDAVRYFAERLEMDPDELATGRPPHLHVDLQLRLATARHAASTGDLGEAERAFTEAREEAASHRMARIEGQALDGLARCAERAGDITAARGYLEQAEEALAGEPLTARIPIIVGRTRLLRLNGELSEAAYLLESTLDRLEREELADPDAVVQLNYGLVGVYVDLGVLDRAAHAADAALALAGKVDDPEHVAAMYVQVSRTFLTRGRWSDAEAALDRAHATYRKLDYLLETAMCHWARGYIYSREKRYTHAERELITARDMMRRLDSWHYAGALASELSTVQWRLGNSAAALSALEDAWRLESESRGAQLPIADAHRVRGLIARDDGILVLAEEHLRAALDGYLRANAGPDAANTARLLGDLLHAADRDADAIEVYRTGLTAAEPPNSMGLV